MAFLGAVTQRDDHIGRPFQMVGDLFFGLGGDLGHALVGRAFQRAQQLDVPGVKQELAHQRLAEIAIRTLDQQGVSELGRVAQIGHLVGIAALALDFGGILQPKLALADQVKRLVGQRDVLFQHGRVPAPFRHAVAKDQRTVAKPLQPVHEHGPIDRLNLSGSHHICPTSAGMSKKVG